MRNLRLFQKTKSALLFLTFLLAAILFFSSTSWCIGGVKPHRGYKSNVSGNLQQKAGGKNRGTENREETAAWLAEEKSWEFERFDVDVVVNPDSSLSIRETQVVNFTGSFSFLNRDLSHKPGNFSGGRTYGKVRFRDIKVKTLDGKPYAGKWSVKRKGSTTNVHIEFSAHNEQMGWIIEYKMSGAIIFYPDYDRLYYNTVSIERDVPIHESRTRVWLPEGVDLNNVRTTYYVNAALPPQSHSISREGRALVWHAKGIWPYAPFTIDVAFPKGFVNPPYQFQSWFAVLVGIVSLAIALLTLVIMLFLWWKKGRDAEKPELDIVRYEPPEDLSPSEASILLEESTDIKHIIATIVDLAVRGKLKIVEKKKEGIFHGTEFEFTRLTDDYTDLNKYEQKIMKALFEKGDTVTEEDLRDSFYVHVPPILKSMMSEVMKKRLFAKNPEKVRVRYISFSFVFTIPIILILVSVRWFDPGYYYLLIPGFVLSAVAIIIIANFMPARTEKGSLALSYVKGFREYLSTAEREEMEFATPEIFQRNLPFAMALGVAKKWARRFESIPMEPPSWYDSRIGSFSPIYLCDSLSHMESSVGRTLASSPASAVGSSGGFGGGGAGGGFGGGGSSAG